MKIHFCLVSAQAAANLLPALDPDIKPEKVILIVSDKMQSQAINLSKTLQEVGVKSESHRLSNEHDYARTEEELLELASHFENDDVALNITGGTKLMSLAAQSVASIAKWQMFYVDLDTDQIIWLGTNALSPKKLSQQLHLRHYLQSYGFNVQKTPTYPVINRQKQALIDTLLMQIGSLEQSLAQLNWLSQLAEKTLTVRMNAEQGDSRSLEALIRNFQDAGALSVEGNDITFTSPDQLKFVKGGWLESHVSQVLGSLNEKLNIRASATNLEVVDQASVKNELDFTFLAHNRLFIIECKTARMDKPESPKANDTLFKLAENCRRIGGLGSHGMLVSYRALRDSEKKLANALNIKCVCGMDINRLSEHIKNWVRH